MYDIYANIWGILMVNVTIWLSIQYMDPMGNGKSNTQGNLLVGGSVLKQIQVWPYGLYVDFVYIIYIYTQGLSMDYSGLYGLYMGHL